MHEQADRARDGALRRGGHAGIGAADAGPIALLSLGPVAGVGDVGRQEVELERQVGRRGLGDQVDAALADDEIDPDLARGQHAVDFVDAVPAEPAVDETAAGQQVEARLVGGQADLAAAEADGDPDRPRLERRRLDVEHNPVAVADPGDAQAGNLLARGDARGLAELGVGEGIVGPLGRGRHRDRAAGLEGGQDLGPGVGELHRAGDEDLRLAPVPEPSQCLIDVGRAQVAGQLAQECYIGIRRGEHGLVGDRVHELVGEARRFAGLGPGGRRFQLVAENRQLLVELGLGKAVRQGAAQLLLTHGQGLAPGLGGSGQLDQRDPGRRRQIERTGGGARERRAGP